MSHPSTRYSGNAPTSAATAALLAGGAPPVGLAPVVSAPADADDHRLLSREVRGQGGLGRQVWRRPLPHISSHSPVPPPLQSLERVTASLDAAAVLTPEAEAALGDLVSDFVDGALSFGAAMARRRGGDALTATDVAPYLARIWQEREWGRDGGSEKASVQAGEWGPTHPQPAPSYRSISVPGYSGDAVRPYRRPAPSDMHRARLAAVARAVEAEEEAAAAAAAVAGKRGK